MESDPDHAREALEKAQLLTQEGSDAVRQSVAALRESPLGKRTLVDALAQLVQETRSGGLVVDFTVEGEPWQFDPRVELALYRAAQEGLTNVRKHARASQVDLLLRVNAGQEILMTVSDNGIGAVAGKQTGFGLLGIRERLEPLGGEMAVGSRPGQGFTLTISVPLEAPETETAAAVAVAARTSG